MRRNERPGRLLGACDEVDTAKPTASVLEVKRSLGRDVDFASRLRNLILDRLTVVQVGHDPGRGATTFAPIIHGRLPGLALSISSSLPRSRFLVSGATRLAARCERPAKFDRRCISVGNRKNYSWVLSFFAR